jgi:hypothetical protein
VLLQIGDPRGDLVFEILLLVLVIRRQEKERYDMWDGLNGCHLGSSGRRKPCHIALSVGLRSTTTSAIWLRSVDQSAAMG